MRNLYDQLAPKKATNVSINSDLLRLAKELNINLSATLEKVLKVCVRELKGEQWLNENKAAIEAYNHYVESSGVFSDGLRRF